MVSLQLLSQLAVAIAWERFPRLLITCKIGEVPSKWSIDLNVHFLAWDLNFSGSFIHVFTSIFLKVHIMTIDKYIIFPVYGMVLVNKAKLGKCKCSKVKINDRLDNNDVYSFNLKKKKSI